MIFLNDDVLIEKKITHDNIKPRLLGHWGTCPGLVMVYAHLNRIIRKTGLDALYVVGPGNEYNIFFAPKFTLFTGHGAPAILSCLWLEDSLGNFMPEYTRERTGLTKLISRFSAPGGFPRYVLISIFRVSPTDVCCSHINAATPGAIHEGGELGYALSVSFGAVMDNPDLVVACIVGDGEAETGPTATYVLLVFKGFVYAYTIYESLAHGMDSNTSILPNRELSFPSSTLMASRSLNVPSMVLWITKK